MSVDVGIAQLVGDGVQEQVATLVVQVDSQVLQDVHVGVVDDVRHRRILTFRAVEENFFVKFC